MIPDSHVAPTASLDRSPSWPLADDPRVVAALESYLDAVQLGRRPSRQDFLDEHSEIASALGACLDGLEFLRSAARGLSSPERVPGLREAFPPATCLGDYRIIREIGRGGMGVVYEADQISLSRRVALKVLPFAAAIDPRQRQRFHVEAQAAAHLHHPHIVPIFAVGNDGGSHFYAMQYIEGRTLAATIQELRRFGGLSRGEAFLASRIAPSAESSPTIDAPPTVTIYGKDHANGSSSSLVASKGSDPSSQRGRAYYRAVARLGIEAAEALEHAHGLGVLHRDIKPANLLIDLQGKLWVTDFGLARFRDDPGPTQTGDLLGTLRYMSPEQLEARRGVVDQRADVYALGATLYEAVTLRPAFTGRDRHEIISRIFSDEPTRPRKIDPAIPRDLETIIRKAMSKEPSARYATAQELADDLRRFLDDQAIFACPPSPLDHGRRWVRKHWTLVATAATVLFAATAVGSVLVLAEQKKTSAALDTTTTALHQAEERLDLSHRATDTMAEATIALSLRAMETMTNYGVTVLRKQDRPFYELALQFYERTVQTLCNDPSPRRREMLARANFSLGLTRMLLGNPDSEAAYLASIELYEKLLSEQPYRVDILSHFIDSLRYLGMHYNAARKFEKAEQVHSRLLAIERELVKQEPENPDYANTLSRDLLNYERILADCGKVVEAEQLLVDFLKAKPGHSLAMNNLAWLLAFDVASPIHDPQRAVGLARKAVKSMPDEPNYWNTLGLSLLRSGDLPGAADALETSMRQNKGGTAHDWFLMAIVHARCGDRPKAQAQYQKGLDGLAKNPSDPELAKLRDEAAEAMGLSRPRTASTRPKSPKIKPRVVSPAAASRPSGPVAEDTPPPTDASKPVKPREVRPHSRAFEID